ncbi:MAG TPA: GNAT family N-acetyltransferase, partial [Pseudonocardiaceae bacterium]|nr:GNAT family N-acetyltransferase [Pseudonocardiaceae bacterium]
VALRAAMSAEMNIRYADRLGDEDVHAALAVAHDSITYTALARDADGTAVGHLALRRVGDDLEVKRVYVAPAARGTGVARVLLADAEAQATKAGVTRLVLHTGDRQPEAVALYTTAGYTPVPVFPPYDRLPFGLCLAKNITSPAPAGTTPHPC